MSHTLTPIATVEDGHITLFVVMEDEDVHTDARPFCNDDSCPCHEDRDLMDEYIHDPLNAGLLSNAEAIRRYWAYHL